MSLMPCFDKGQAYDEGIIIGRILAGYGEVELQMCKCLIVAEGTLDIPLRRIFGKRGADLRIKIGTKELSPDYTNAGLLGDLSIALADLDWCREIRNQYSHCQWFWTKNDGLCFVNLEQLAKQPTQILSVVDAKCSVSLLLLNRQEGFFWYVKQQFMHLEAAYRTWDQNRGGRRVAKSTSFVYPKPPTIARPPLHN